MENQKQRARLDAFLTARCMTDFWTCMKYGLYPTQMKHYHQPLHGNQWNTLLDRPGLAHFLQNWERDHYGHKEPVLTKFVIMAREHCKTQEGIAWAVWQMIRDRNERFLLRSHTDPKAREILRGIKEVILSDPVQARFPWVRPAMEGMRRKEWASDRIILERDDVGIRTSSIEAYGLEADPTGGRAGLRPPFDTPLCQSRQPRMPDS